MQSNHMKTNKKEKGNVDSDYVDFKEDACDIYSTSSAKLEVSVIKLYISFILI